MDYERLPIERFSENGGSIPHNVALQIYVDLIYQASLRSFTKLTDTVNITVYAGAFTITIPYTFLEHTDH